MALSNELNLLLFCNDPTPGTTHGLGGGAGKFRRLGEDVISRACWAIESQLDDRRRFSEAGISNVSTAVSAESMEADLLCLVRHRVGISK